MKVSILDSDEETVAMDNAALASELEALMSKLSLFLDKRFSRGPVSHDVLICFETGMG